MKNGSTWLQDISIPRTHQTLVGDVLVDVVIVGGGLAGTITGYLLSKAGKKVVILEKKDVSNSVTAYTTAWLNCVVDTDLSDLVKMYGENGTKKIWSSGMDAINLIENIVKEEGIDCEWGRVSHFRYAESKRDLKNLEEENKWAKRLGFETMFHDKGFLPFSNEGSFELKSQAKFNPIKFLLGIRSAAEKYGAVIYENTEAKGITGDGLVIVNTDNGKVTADYLVITTHKPFNDPKELSAHSATYISYVFEVEIPKNTITPGLYEDEKNPYHYFRIDSGQNSDRMILGGEDHRKEIPMSPDKNFGALEVYLDKLLPGVKYEIVRRWFGPIIETIDGLPYIGKYSKKYSNRLVATGFSGNGMTFSAVAGQILSDIVLKKENLYTDLYFAGRKTKLTNVLRKAIDFTFEFFGGAFKNFFR